MVTGLQTLTVRLAQSSHDFPDRHRRHRKVSFAWIRQKIWKHAADWPDEQKDLTRAPLVRPDELSPATNRD